MSARVFIDGQSGTTGLGIQARLESMSGIELAELPPAERKNPTAKADILRTVDLAILCLPNEAAEESAALISTLGNSAPRVLDASTAHRIAPGWVYGFPELESGQSDKIRAAQRVANPGCHATGAIALLRPLVDAGLLPADFPVTITSVSGYSGGGKSMIADFESGRAPRFELYALELEHKHVPEIMAYGGLTRRPIFVPSVGNFAQGMLVSIPLFLDDLPEKPDAMELHAALASHYVDTANIRVLRPDGETRLEPESLNDTNDLELRVFANPARRQAVLVAKFDNLGKGASGAAIQNLQLMLGLSE
ncbi:MAG TPA: N-acetyl-gamma-glutamyl-phosphate reductase [Methylovirgula sp.]